jgi:hypothetical protein
MSPDFGINHHANSGDDDDGSDQFVISRYKEQILGSGAAAEKLAVGDFYEVEISKPSSTNWPKTNQVDDNAHGTEDTPAMNEITREELGAKLETIEVKMDARVEAMSSKIDAFLALQAERDKRLDESLGNIRGDITRLGSLKLSIWGAMFTGLAITVTVIALGLTSYQAGQADRRPAAQPSQASQQGK